MPTRELEQIMSDFYHGRFQILVCTTIIETGIDIPNANTIIYLYLIGTWTFCC
jgi:transcription-repair coupling factor (superfamily II helicase)